MEKSELGPKQVFDFVGYQFDLKEGKVRPTLDRRQTLTTKIRELLTEWWLEENNVLQGQPLHPLKHALQMFTDASKEGWGAHLK